MNGFLEILIALIQANANLNFQDLSGNTALLWGII